MATASVGHPPNRQISRSRSAGLAPKEALAAALLLTTTHPLPLLLSAATRSLSRYFACLAGKSLPDLPSIFSCSILDYDYDYDGRLNGFAISNSRSSKVIDFRQSLLRSLRQGKFVINPRKFSTVIARKNDEAIQALPRTLPPSSRWAHTRKP